MGKEQQLFLLLAQLFNATFEKEAVRDKVHCLILFSRFYSSFTILNVFLGTLLHIYIILSFCAFLLFTSLFIHLIHPFILNCLYVESSI